MTHAGQSLPHESARRHALVTSPAVSTALCGPGVGAASRLTLTQSHQEIVR